VLRIPTTIGDHRRARARGKKPTWGGFIPQFLGFDLCQQIREVLTSDQDYATWTPRR
jgi:hypothetical protein